MVAFETYFSSSRLFGRYTLNESLRNIPPFRWHFLRTEIIPQCDSFQIIDALFRVVMSELFFQGSSFNKCTVSFWKDFPNIFHFDDISSFFFGAITLKCLNCVRWLTNPPISLLCLINFATYLSQNAIGYTSSSLNVHP